jgi:hypothetical protein
MDQSGLGWDWAHVHPNFKIFLVNQFSICGEYGLKLMFNIRGIELDDGEGNSFGWFKD